jgi:hypothetical protein
LNLALIAKTSLGPSASALLQDMKGRIGRNSAFLDPWGTIEGLNALIHRNFNDL